jgi:hypothetical protein
VNQFRSLRPLVWAALAWSCRDCPRPEVPHTSPGKGLPQVAPTPLTAAELRTHFPAHPQVYLDPPDLELLFNTIRRFRAPYLWTDTSFSDRGCYPVSFEVDNDFTRFRGRVVAHRWTHDGVRHRMTVPVSIRDGRLVVHSGYDLAREDESHGWLSFSGGGYLDGGQHLMGVFDRASDTEIHFSRMPSKLLVHCNQSSQCSPCQLGLRVWSEGETTWWRPPLLDGPAQVETHIWERTCAAKLPNDVSLIIQRAESTPSWIPHESANVPVLYASRQGCLEAVPGSQRHAEHETAPDGLMPND